MKDFLIYIFLITLGFIIRLFPIKIIQKFGKLFGLFFFIYYPSARKSLMTI
jgi:hypothetical protein